MPAAGALPNLVVIGAMKCGTTALHRLLDRHPEIAMAAPKELNFFCGRGAGDGPPPRSWHAGNWHRGLAWYRGQFADAPVRGEASPGYTSPSFPEAAARMASVVPGARLVYLVRDPVARALSQYRHHRRDGTELRPVAKALLDPGSQYLGRSRYFERLSPYLEHFPREQVHVCLQEDLRARPRATLAALFGFLGVDAGLWCPDPERREPSARDGVALDRRLVRRLRAWLADDVARLGELCGRDLSAWAGSG